MNCFLRTQIILRVTTVSVYSLLLLPSSLWGESSLLYAQTPFDELLNSMPSDGRGTKKTPVEVRSLERSTGFGMPSESDAIELSTIGEVMGQQVVCDILEDWAEPDIDQRYHALTQGQKREQDEFFDDVKTAKGTDSARCMLQAVNSRDGDQIYNRGYARGRDEILAIFNRSKASSKFGRRHPKHLDELFGSAFFKACVETGRRIEITSKKYGSCN